MATDIDANFEISLRPDWENRGTSKSQENFLVEVEFLLSDAPNVEAIYWIQRDFNDGVAGVAVSRSDGSRNFYMAADFDELSFDSKGNLLFADERDGIWAS